MLEEMSNSPSGSRRRPKPTQENWDDDFEFSLPKKAGSSSNSKSRVKDENVPLSTTRNESPTEDWDENWDESPPRPLPPPIMTTQHQRKKTSIPPPISIPSSSSSRGPPRLSPSQTSSLSISPLPTAHSSPQHPLLPSRSHSSAGLSLEQQPRLRSGSTTANGTIARNKLIKRHPSTSFVPILSHSSSHVDLSALSEASLRSSNVANRSSPNLPPGSPYLPRSTSGEQMPPPPLPAGGILSRARSRSRSKVRPDSKNGVRVSSIPFSPSKEDMTDTEKEKRPGFWKRLSGAPVTASKQNDGTTQHRRRRSSSVGSKQVISGSPRPPVPPLPTNLRSPSGASSTSTSSAKSGPTSAFSALLRRSSSSLSRRTDKSKETPPPSSYPYFTRHGASTSSINSVVQQGVPIPSRRGNITPDLPSSASFTGGFHLPSPSPRSPYHAPQFRMPSSPIGQSEIPPLPHSTSFPGPIGRQQEGSSSDTETEGESKTPKKRKKIRPVSALPASTSEIAGTQIQNPIPGLPISRQHSCEASIGLGRSSDSPSGFASTTTSTLKRLSSLSKKHGRRLSGGWKFGTASSTDSSKSTMTPLEPVVGSPSKPHNRDEGQPVSPASPTPDLNPQSEEELRKAIRAGSVSAPTSLFMSPPSSLDSQTSTAAEITKFTPSEALAKEKEKKDKHRRRQSWNDFVIPREVMMKQKGLKEGIGAVKMFAGGVASLKTLLNTHADLRDRILASGTPSDAAYFATLDAEFEQWLEMAVVLIEVGSTGTDPANQPSFSSPPRSRRVTLASDESKAASATMSKAISAPNPPVQLSAWRKASLPDPEEHSSGNGTYGPPNPDPDHWRASTGRQDLSKRQLEVLRTMLRTPVANTPDRPVLGLRTSSTLSASTNSSYLNTKIGEDQGSPSPQRLKSTRSTRGVTPESDISFPSPGDSAHIQPSASFPSPLSGRIQHHPPSQAQKSLKDRRASKAGLAGLKEFLRSLKKDRGTQRLPSGDAGDSSPLRIKSRMFGIKASTSPPASPTSPLSPAFTKNPNDVFYPTQRSTFSALGSAASPGIPETPQTAPMLQQRFSARNGSRSRADTDSSPKLGPEQKRPSIRNIFRTTSGNWSELVNSSNNIGPLSPGLSKKSSIQKLGFSKSNSAQILSKISVSDPIPSKIPLSASSRTLYANDLNPYFGATGEDQSEMTLRAGTAKKRTSGLGLGLGWPESQSQSNTSSIEPSSGVAIGEMGTVFGSPSKMDYTFKASINMPKSPSKIRLPSNRSSNSISTLNSTTSIRIPSNENQIKSLKYVEYESNDSQFPQNVEVQDLTIALTPENLPTLLEYLKQCERMLGYWRERVEEIMGVGANLAGNRTE
ncbi:uncharacterized protein I206_100222 [Kwoniella pini CBS 10737]|uniref:Uncharacterized protein n=1 Tax=Kwoniella pini CBS 10737 TaxID=1296096 RepID=A0A1B9IE17_9TREE|nr:uncharacterized protein I206_01103 [Kwoniella pini CBS 10737]OCF53796.1 hypothetical protein I206_01103 [Kwoniella pini CBS 10737]